MMVHPHVCVELDCRCCAYGLSVGSSPVCGELDILSGVECNFPGSSPRVWGTLRTGLTSQEINAVHPHVCGELDAIR